MCLTDRIYDLGQVPSSMRYSVDGCEFNVKGSTVYIK
jgi:hypothetical protein